MFRSVRARLVTGLMLGAVLLSTAAAPATAASQTRWVDNDNNPGDGPAACNNANFSSIQAAINASSAWDKVHVCPGTYDEQVTINKRGLQVRSLPTKGAKIVPPAEAESVDDMTALGRITARQVSLVGFKLIFQDRNPVGPPVEAQPCTQFDGAIVADAPHARVYSNLIKTTGDYTYSGDCGYLTGIVLGSDTLSGPAGFASASFDGDTSVVAHNRVADFKYIGIGVGGDRSARVYSNKIRYVHANDPSTCVVTPVLGIQGLTAAPSLSYPCELTLTGIPQSLVVLPFSVGIGVAGALVDLRKNSVYSTLDVELCDVFFEFCPNVLGVGIGMLDPAPGSRVRNNTVTNTFFAVGTLQEFGGPPTVELPPAPDGVQFTGNRINENILGFFLAGSNNVFYGNRAHLNAINIFVLAGANNEFSSNDFRYHIDVDGDSADCVDETSGGGDEGTANWWGDTNWGYDNYPSNICTAPFII